MSPIKTILRVGLVPLIMVISLSGRSLGDSGPTVFVNGLQFPLGLATDQDGNVFVHSDATFTTLLTKYNADGMPLGQIQLGGITVDQFGGSRLVRDPITGNILLLTTHGVLYFIDRNTGQGGVLVDLSRLAFSTYDKVFDVLLRGYRPFGIGNPDYGDFTALRRSDTLMDLFIFATTGASGGFPFVMRVRVDYQQLPAYSADVILTSQGTTAGNVNQPEGIAVNAAGTVLTALPFPVRRQSPPDDIGGFANGLVAFGADFSNTANCPADPSCPRWIFTYPDGQPVDFDNAGMTTDAAGNFYIASGIVGSSVCGLAAGDALVVFPSNLDASQGKCLPVQFPIGHNSDVAVAPSVSSENIVYMTIHNSSGGILKFLITSPSPPAPQPQSQPQFQPQSLRLTVNKTGSGTVVSSKRKFKIKCGVVCSQEYSKPEKVRLKAKPAKKWALVRWSGCDSTRRKICDVNIHGERIVSAVFEQKR